MPPKPLPIPRVSASGFEFLKALKKNNNRDWFNARKPVFEQEQEAMAVFAEALLQRLQAHDEIETPSGKKSLHRIYRDTRFSADKTPYKNNWSGHYRRATKYRRGGYYFHLEPGNSFLAGGFWAPNPADLKRIRDEIAFDDAPLRKILGSPSFKNTFGTLQGEQVKTAPKGYAADEPAIDLLRYKQFLLIRKFRDAEVLAGDFLDKAAQTFQHMRPFFDYMSQVLTGDGNGEIE